MPMMDGEESGDEEVERSPNEEENGSEEDEEDDTMSSASEDSSSDSIDETENERRRAECMDDMQDLERQFVELKEQLYCERISQVEKKLDEVASGLATEYNGPLAELKEMCEIRLEVADILKQHRLVNVKHKYDAEEQSVVQHFESEKLALMEGMKADFEEKIRKLEEDKHNIDISADVWLESQSMHKKHRRAADGVLFPDKRRKPVTISGPYVVYMLKEMDILEDWAAIRKAKGALARRKAQNSSRGSYHTEKIPFSARYEDGKLYYEGEWFHKGSQIVIEGKEGTNYSAMVTGINTGEILVRRNDGYKTKLYIGQLQKGKFKIRKQLVA